MGEKAERKPEQITVSYKTVRRFALVYIAIPFFIFAVSWLSFLPAIGCACGTVVTLVLTLISNNSSKEETVCFHKADDTATLQIHPFVFLGIVVIAAIWAWWSGIGEGFYQSNDFTYRNAIFRDLINYDWPVIYNEEKGMLVYYIGFWLPAACVGKLCLFLTANADFTWLVSVFTLYIWAFIGITITFFLFVFCTKAKSPKAIFAVLFLFVFFSGMDIVGWAFGGFDGFFGRIAERNVHIEWWAKILSEQTGKYLQYSSFTTQLFWVFNQSIITWICVLLLLQEKTPMHYVFVGMMCLFNGPLPFVGFFIVAMIKGAEFVWQHRKKSLFFITKIFSLSNIFSAIGIFPVCLLYFTGNSAAAVSSGERSARTDFGRIFKIDGAFSAKALWIVVAFLLLEFGILALLLLKRKKTDPVFWGCVGMLTLFPFVVIGSAGDFCMRATIPALLCLCVYSCEAVLAYFPEERKQRKGKKVVALLCVLIIGSATPLVEFSRGVYKSIEAGRLLTYNEQFFTLADVMEDEGNTLNFTSADYKDSNFYRLIAKKH